MWQLEEPEHAFQQLFVTLGNLYRMTLESALSMWRYMVKNCDKSYSTSSAQLCHCIPLQSHDV